MEFAQVLYGGETGRGSPSEITRKWIGKRAHPREGLLFFWRGFAARGTRTVHCIVYFPTVFAGMTGTGINFRARRYLDHFNAGRLMEEDDIQSVSRRLC